LPVYRLDLEYDGADYHGWQVQPGCRTVQGELGAALERLCGAPVRVVGAGRTDAGVHALGQVASFETERELEPRRLLRALGAGLPEDVRVWRAGRASPGFSARASALSRSYSYRMLRRPSPLGRRLRTVLRFPVDVVSMGEAASALGGRHDFTAFASSRTSRPNPICDVLAAEIRGDDIEVRFEVTADHFLHNMVRRLAGVLVEVGRGRLAPDDLRRILEAGDRSRGGPCLPACGLFLVSVAYPSDPEFDSSAVVDGPRWSP
jgi:tRNA pseudouridine38-40 synthase